MTSRNEKNSMVFLIQKYGKFLSYVILLGTNLLFLLRMSEFSKEKYYYFDQVMECASDLPNKNLLEGQVEIVG